MPSNPSTTPRSMSLLITLGLTQAVVPEAFFLPGTHFDSVHVLTSAGAKADMLGEFFATHAPGVRWTLTRAEDFVDLTSEEDHFRFEEVLLRWILEMEPDVERRHVCLAGGYKTISSSAQRAASALGAAEVFHVLADPYLPGKDNKGRPPFTLAEVIEARDTHHLHFVRLGGEPGWPQLRRLNAAAHPLQVRVGEGGVRWVRASDQELRHRLKVIVERSQRIAASWSDMADLPFAELATWPGAALEWLGSPVDPEEDADWIAGLPKVELHCHLGGFATGGDALERIRMAASVPGSLPPIRPMEMPEDWPLPGKAVGLERYRQLGDNNGSALLRDPGCLKAQCRELYRHFVGQRIAYAEVRCSPANYATTGRSPWEVLQDIRETFEDEMQSAERAGQWMCHVNLIIIGTRQSMGDYRAGISRHLSLAVTAAEHGRDGNGCRVVGVDLAGYEDPSTRAHYFREEFVAIHRCGLALTVHAGENDDAEGIWRAVFDLNARRIGHALSLRDSRELLASMADRGIAVEMCPYANLQIQGFDMGAGPGIKRCYPLKDYLQRGIRVTVNTDNIGISGASLTDNLLLAARLCPKLTRRDVLQLQRNALDAAFVTPEMRRRLLVRLAEELTPPGTHGRRG